MGYTGRGPDENREKSNIKRRLSNPSATHPQKQSVLLSFAVKVREVHIQPVYPTGLRARCRDNTWSYRKYLMGKTIVCVTSPTKSRGLGPNRPQSNSNSVPFLSM